MKRVVLKEELAAITKDYKLAMVLNQMMYWALRTKDTAAYKKEEHLGETQVSGWIYKSGEELAEEMMMNVSSCSMRTYLKKLVAAGWLTERSNPNYKWDKTRQYRVSWRKIENDVCTAGYTLEDSWMKPSPAVRTTEDPASIQKNSASNAAVSSAIPENTSKITGQNIRQTSLLQTYEKQFGKAGPAAVQKLETWTTSDIFDDSRAVLTYALELAAAYQARSFAYVEAMLKSWIHKGKVTLQTIKETDAPREAEMPKLLLHPTPAVSGGELTAAKAEAAKWRHALKQKRNALAKADSFTCSQTGHTKSAMTK
ncbi:DnaD domain protein [Alkalicoccus halolimnae]|uniref:DnaD domain protein n=1 Tax=Alkalicoccus halolimnae TaxID=1667239 RepID=A0A5C7FHY8_9BACI|nr:DnaD domain protein [Alkalicoccus halolimnae]TXF85904.1 DnaD domain protein [Alkalicoccus halolimnae]